jgi:glutathione synthase
VKPPKLLWITDPWDTLDHPRETTLRLAQEALKMGVPNAWCDVRSIRWENGSVLNARVFEEIPDGMRASEIRMGASRVAKPIEFRSLQYRTDPPVDLAYLHPLQILMSGLPGSASARIVNPAPVLALSNEKLEASWLPKLMPPTLVSSQWEALERFGRKEGRVVLKPLHQAQSKGVELLDWSDSSAAVRVRQIIESATGGFRNPVLLQRYLEAIREGEQRLWFLDGRLLGFVRKLPKEGDFRVNLDQGSRVATTKLTAGEKKAGAAIGKRLRALGIRLAAVDLIDGLITDFNFTSPGLIVQMEELLGENLARPIVKALVGAPRS